MQIFGNSAQYYDLLYSSKKYDKEVDYVDALIRKFAPTTSSVLDLGCGTGTHGMLLARKNYKVVGVDQSAQMVALARQKASGTGSASIEFSEGDIRTIELGKTFDAVVSLFHVMCYLTSQSDMSAGFANVAKHLKPSGLFIFDCWYGPAVLTDLPKVGVRRLENDILKVTRVVEPELHPNRNVVVVNYEIFVEDKKRSQTSVVKETHSVRYFFKPEIEKQLSELGMEILSCEEWLTGKPPGLGSFGVCFVARKI